MCVFLGVREGQLNRCEERNNQVSCFHKLMLLRFKDLLQRKAPSWVYHVSLSCSVAELCGCRWDCDASYVCGEQLLVVASYASNSHCDLWRYYPTCPQPARFWTQRGEWTKHLLSLTQMSNVSSKTGFQMSGVKLVFCTLKYFIFF